MYIYSVGKRLCGTHVRITDHTIPTAPSLVYCFHSLPGHRFSSLAFHIYADLLYFSDASDHKIHRMRMETSGEHVQTIAANTGKIGGEARFSFKRNRLRCVRCVNENRKKRKRLRWQAANHGVALSTRHRLSGIGWVAQW